MLGHVQSALTKSYLKISFKVSYYKYQGQVSDLITAHLD